jgi:ATP-binding protein involved in chromosome partitioning
MAAPTADQLRTALRAVRDPRSGKDIVAAGLIDSLETRESLVHLALRTERAHAQAMEAVCRQAEAVLARQPGVTNATVVLTAHRPEPAAAPAPGPAGRPALLPGVKHVVAVASGKGGVGKSTTAVNLAVALAQSGHRVGLLDADVYGPSLPRMLGVAGKPELVDGRMAPLKAWGLLAMSIGLLVDQDTAMIWRGPMVMSALEQMMGQVAWGELDILVVDMPPGTGDAQLTMAQRVSLSGAVIVSTPQDVALIDARRGVRMFEKVMVPVLGLVENMSFFACPHCGETTNLFGHGGARREAEALGVPFLGEVPLLLDIRETSDAGTPIVAQAPDSPAAKAYSAIAERVWKGLAGVREAGPRIVME